MFETGFSYSKLVSKSCDYLEVYELRILLVEQGKISVLHVRHAFYNIPASFSSKKQLEITHIYFLIATFRKQHYVFTFLFYFNGMPVVPRFANIEQFKPDGIILRQLY